MSDHDDIKARKTMAEILASFSSLVGMLLLFNRESPYYRLSGIIGYAVLEHDQPDLKGMAVLTMFNPNDGASIGTLVSSTRAELEELLTMCDAFVGHTPEDSFLLAP